MKPNRSQRAFQLAQATTSSTIAFYLSIDSKSFDESLIDGSSPDPFDLVAAIEEEQLNINQRNLLNKRVTLTMNSHTNTSNTVQRTVAGQIINVRRLVGESPAEILGWMTSDRLKADIASSVAWSIDNGIIFRARMVATELYKLEYDGIAQSKEVYEAFMDDFINLFDERNEEIFQISENAKMMLILMGMRDEYHEIAGRAFARQLRQYSPPSLHGLLMTEKPRELRENDMAMLKIEVDMAREEFGLTKEEAAALLTDTAMVEATNYAEEFKRRKRFDHTTLILIDRAEIRVGDRGYEFHDLSPAVQATILTQMQGALARAKVRARQFCKTVSEYMPVAAEGIKVHKAIEASLVTLRDKVEEQFINDQKRKAADFERKQRQLKAKAKGSEADDFEHEEEAKRLVAQAKRDEAQATIDAANAAITQAQADTSALGEVASGNQE